MEGERAALAEAKRDATLSWLKEQRRSGSNIVSDGEQYRQHFVHGSWSDRRRRLPAQAADRHPRQPLRADCPVIVAPLRRPGAVHAEEVALVRAHTTRPFKFTLPGR